MKLASCLLIIRSNESGEPKGAMGAKEKSEPFERHQAGIGCFMEGKEMQGRCSSGRRGDDDGASDRIHEYDFFLNRGAEEAAKSLPRIEVETDSEAVERKEESKSRSFFLPK